MIVCGDDALAERLAQELRKVYGEQVTVVVPLTRPRTGPETRGSGRARAAAWFSRMQTVVSRTAAAGQEFRDGRDGRDGREARDTGGAQEGDGMGELRVLEAAEPDGEILSEAGVARASAVALVYDDDETNIRAALAARRLNSRVRLVIRLYNRKLGQHLEKLLDQAAVISFLQEAGERLPGPRRADGGGGAGARDGGGGTGARDGGGAGQREEGPGRDRTQHGPARIDAATSARIDADISARIDASTTVLSDADTAAPALAATVVAGTTKVIQRAGLMFRAVERPAPAAGTGVEPGVVTLALLAPTPNDTAGVDSWFDTSAPVGPRLLPDDETVVAAEGRARVVLEGLAYAPGSAPGPGRLAGRRVPIRTLFSQRLRWSLAVLLLCVLALAVISWLTTGDHPLHAGYLTLLDLFAMGDPALGESTARQSLQLLSGLAGLLLMPVLLAAVFEALGTFRSASALRRPPRGLSGHVVLLGLGKVGTRVLARLRELGIPVVCVEADPEARGVALARRLRVPTIIGDVTQEGVLEAAKIGRADALLALTSSDTTNLEAALYARSVKADLRVSLRLYDDAFASAVFRTLRAAHPRALTRSRSVTTLAAPAFAGAMMGRQIIGAIPVERSVLLFAAVDVAGHPLLEGRTFAEAFRPERWRVLALDPGESRGGRGGRGERGNGSERGNPGGRDGGRDRNGNGGGPFWAPDPSYVLDAGDRVLLVATRQGLAELLRRHP
ncbi:NAD-binding protein [Streptomyces sp. NA04227]|uniref:NAD-binding protein n=1 Tax=Streptomyces sp. NA04227 TaxID=2742136 RepID=UPI0015917A40|nr:NAD-binding protein [Streptomyces sp. NA04227]QKW08117.1 NAD-binding protein [Streptomyces sp. NA04227]